MLTGPRTGRKPWEAESQAFHCEADAEQMLIRCMLGGGDPHECAAFGEKIGRIGTS